MYLKELKIAVTGGAGFIGSHLVDQLLEPARKNRVVVVDNFSVGLMENLAQHSGNDRLRIVRGDVRNPADLETAFQGVDLVFHLATDCVRVSLMDPITNHEVNARGTLNTLEAARKCGAKRYIYCSSSEVYGNIAESLKRGGGDILAEDSSKLPTTVYGASKLVGEHYALAYHQTYGLQSMVVRPFNAYGPRSHVTGPYGEVIPRFVTMIRAGLQPVVFGTGTQTRDFTYVTDTAAGLIASAESDRLLGDSINLAHGEEVSVIELARTLSELHGIQFAPKYVEGRPGEIQRLGCDNRKAREILGSTPALSIREGLTLYLRWLDELKLDYRELARQLTEKNWTEKR